MILTNTLDMILAVARTPGCAPVEQIVMRPEIRERIEREDGSDQRLDDCGITIVIDERIPMFPGFEVHRERW